MKKILQDLSYAEVQALAESMGEKKFRVKQLYEGLTQGKKISGITSLPKSFKEKLLSEYEDECVAVQNTFVSSDGTEKYLFRLADGNLVEGVLMKYKYGYTQCVSTQVGCRMGCKFCASTLGGLVRNLTAGEILSQILAINALHKEDAGAGKRAVTNVVLMGSGEPLDNYDETVKFLRNVTAEEGLNVSARNISLSTCGLVPKMYALANEGIPVNLTVSLHATDDGERKRKSVSDRGNSEGLRLLFRADGQKILFRIYPHRRGELRRGACPRAGVPPQGKALPRQSHPPQRSEGAGAARHGR